MKRQLEQLSQLLMQYKVPLIIPGDIFDTWYSPAELINFALKYLPPCYAVPGNHDLPEHQFRQLRRSAFYTLVEAGVITLLYPDRPVEVDGGDKVLLQLHGFPHGFPPYANPSPHQLCADIAVIHHYCWKDPSSSYEGAEEHYHTSQWYDTLQGYDFALVGDNHTPFNDQVGECQLINVGSFFRRRSKEISHTPSIVLGYSDNTFSRSFLDVSQDIFLEEISLTSPRGGRESPSFSDPLVNDLSSLGEQTLDFQEEIIRHCDRQSVTQPVRKRLLKAMETIT